MAPWRPKLATPIAHVGHSWLVAQSAFELFCFKVGDDRIVCCGVHLFFPPRQGGHRVEDVRAHPLLPAHALNSILELLLADAQTLLEPAAERLLLIRTAEAQMRSTGFIAVVPRIQLEVGVCGQHCGH